MHNFFFFFFRSQREYSKQLFKKNDQDSLTTIPHTIMVKLDQRKQNVKDKDFYFFAQLWLDVAIMQYMH